MSDVVTALRRASIRLRYHGWRQGRANPNLPGFTLREAVIGRNSTLVPQCELDALIALADAIGTEEIDEWNDAHYRTRQDCLDALGRAMKACKAAPARVPSPCAERRMVEVMDSSPPEAPIPVPVLVPMEVAEGGDAPLPMDYWEQPPDEEGKQ